MKVTCYVSLSREGSVASQQTEHLSLKGSIHLNRRKKRIGLTDNPVHYRVALEMQPVCILCFVCQVSEHSTTYLPSVFNVHYPQINSIQPWLFSFMPCCGHHILSTTRPVKTEECPKYECLNWQHFFAEQIPLKHRTEKQFFPFLLIKMGNCATPCWPTQQGQDKEKRR